MCSEISAVTWFRIWVELLLFPTFMFFTPPYWVRQFTRPGHSEGESLSDLPLTGHCRATPAGARSGGSSSSIEEWAWGRGGIPPNCKNIVEKFRNKVIDGPPYMKPLPDFSFLYFCIYPLQKSAGGWVWLAGAIIGSYFTPSIMAAAAHTAETRCQHASHHRLSLSSPFCIIAIFPSTKRPKICSDQGC